MKNNEMTLLILNLVEIFTSALFSKVRLEWIADRLLLQNAKIQDLVLNFLNINLEYNFLGNKMTSPRHFSYDNSRTDIDKTKAMTIEQGLAISKIFSDALCFYLHLETEAKELIKNKKELCSMVDDLFEMNQALNLFEYKMYSKQAPLVNFKEVCTWDHDIFVVCISDEICEPWGFKSGERRYISHNWETIIGVAPFWYDKNTPLALWSARDSHQFRDPSMPVVVAYKTRIIT